MAGVTRSVGIGMVGLLALGVAGAQPLELSITSSGDDAVEVVVVGGAVEGGWILQDSYNGVDWRDLEEMNGVMAGFSPASVPTTKRFFRAAKKPLATWQEALTQARERWEATGLVKYQYRHRTSGAFLMADDLILVDGRVVKESTSLLPPGFPPFSWGEQTVEDLFDRLQQAIDDNVYSMGVRYHPEMGYPETAYVDPNQMIADEEWGFWIDGVPSEPEASRALSEEQWERRGVLAYEFDLRYETARYGWEGRIRVEGGVAVVLSGGEPLREHIVMTMEGYFTYIGAALAEGKISSAAYDPDLGYPVFFSRDWYLTFADGPGERFWISGLQELEEP